MENLAVFVIKIVFTVKCVDTSKSRRASIFERRRTKRTRVKKAERNAELRSIYAFYAFQSPCRLQYAYTATSLSPSVSENEQTGDSPATKYFT